MSLSLGIALGLSLGRRIPAAAATGYSYYTSIDTKSAAVSANETNFPVVLVVTDSRFATTGNANAYDGHLDELHVASVVRDADWIATTYANQNDPTPDSTFWSALGTEQSL